MRSSLWARLAGFLLAVVVLASSSSYLTRDIRLASGRAPDDHALLPHIVAWTLWLSLLWVFLTLRRAALSRVLPRGWARALLEAALCLSYAYLAVETTHAVLSQALGPPPFPGDLSFDAFKSMMIARSAAMYTFAVVCLAAIFSEVERRRSDNAAKALVLEQEILRRQLATARLETLRSQLNPHFLFNALHAIAGLILADDKLRAHRALASLSTLLRRSLKQGEALTTSVEEELELVSRYIELEQLRFGDRMRFSVEASPDVLHASVPALILLPIVENAVTHGLEPSSDGGAIAVRVSRVDGTLELAVADGGVGRSRAREVAGDTTGIGLNNTRGRLEALYGSSASVHIEDRDAGGTRVTIRLPLQWAPARARRNGAAS